MMRLSCYWFQARAAAVKCRGLLTDCGKKPTTFLQELQPAESPNSVSELGLRPLKERIFSASCVPVFYPGTHLSSFSLSARMCYNHRAVEGAWKQERVSVRPKPADVVSPETVPPQDDPKETARGFARFATPEDVDPPGVAESVDGFEIATNEDASWYCPVCSQRLESRRCKLICAVCGYYMSCADYY